MEVELMMRELLLKELITKSYDSKGIGLLGGKSGILLSLMYGSIDENQDNSYKDSIDNLIEDLVNEINENDLAHSKYSLKELVECFYVFSKLKNDGLIELENSFFEMFSKEINDHLILLSKESNFDNLHGSFTILNYLVESGTLNQNICNEFIRIFIENFYLDGKLNIKPIFYNISKDKKAINYSLSHGLTGKISILLKLYQKYPSAYLKQILFELTDHIFSLALFENVGSNRAIFPSLLHNPTERDYGPVRLAWCYGDLGTAIALFNFYTFFLLEEKRLAVLDALVSLSLRRGLANNGIIDAPFCHGTAGISYIFNKLYIQTGNKCFKDSSDYWEQETENFYLANHNILDLAISYKKGKQDHYKKSFLEGYAGIFLALSAKKNNSFSWDSSLFLS